MFILEDAAITWKSQKQRTIALSSTEAEYMAITEADKEAIWIQSLYSEITGKEHKLQIIPVDNQGAMKLAKNPQFHNRTKHIDIRYHFIRETIESDLVELQYVQTEDNIADILTKALPRPRHEHHMNGMGIQGSTLSLT